MIFIGGISGSGHHMILNIFREWILRKVKFVDYEIQPCETLDTDISNIYEYDYLKFLHLTRDPRIAALSMHERRRGAISLEDQWKVTIHNIRYIESQIDRFDVYRKLDYDGFVKNPYRYKQDIMDIMDDLSDEEFDVAVKRIVPSKRVLKPEYNEIFKSNMEFYQ